MRRRNMSTSGFSIDETTKLKNDPKNNLSKRDRERVEYFENEKSVHEILEAGQDNRKKGIEAVKKEQDEQRLQEEKVKDEILNKFEHKKRFSQSYKALLAQTLAQKLELLDWIRGWNAQVVVTDGSPIMIKGKGFQTRDGLLLLIIAPDGRIFHQGMYCTQEPVVDYLGLENMAIMAENTLDREKHLFKREPKKTPNLLDQYGNAIS